MTPDTVDDAQSQAVQVGLGKRMRRFLASAEGILLMTAINMGLLVLIYEFWDPPRFLWIALHLVTLSVYGFCGWLGARAGEPVGDEGLV